MKFRYPVDWRKIHFFIFDGNSKWIQSIPDCAGCFPLSRVSSILSLGRILVSRIWRMLHTLPVKQASWKWSSVARWKAKFHKPIQHLTFSSCLSKLLSICPFQGNRIGVVIVSVLASSAVDRRFEPRSCQTKDNNIGFCCFSAKHAALRSKSKDSESE